MTGSVFLVHGGLWDAMDAEAFWGTTGIVDGLSSYGLRVLAPDRPQYPLGWDVEIEALGEQLSKQSGPVSNRWGLQWVYDGGAAGGAVSGAGRPAAARLAGDW
ncbi:hypothetical protein AB0E69_05725 [Kribbella sp. NPDC026611]|uniref:hypothetical protein n=1 Tax=Kribbella sp. NPDC026611 TaxID=3154911 RepID=UPI0033E02A66